MSATNQTKSYSIYSSIVTYAIGDVVLYLNNLYICILSSLNHIPTNATYFSSYVTSGTKHSASVTNSTKHNA